MDTFQTTLIQGGMALGGYGKNQMRTQPSVLSGWQAVGSLNTTVCVTCRPNIIHSRFHEKLGLFVAITCYLGSQLHFACQEFRVPTPKPSKSRKPQSLVICKLRGAFFAVVVFLKFAKSRKNRRNIFKSPQIMYRNMLIATKWYLVMIRLFIFMSNLTFF